MGLFDFSSKDWNVVGILFERRDIYRVNGNRAKGRSATRTRDAVKKHQATIFWAVFDQEGKFLEGGPGPSAGQIPPETMKQLQREMPTLGTVREILRQLESKEREKAAKKLDWRGYPDPGS